MSRGKRIRDLVGGEVYSSISEAHRETGVPYETIRCAALEDSWVEGARFVREDVPCPPEAISSLGRACDHGHVTVMEGGAYGSTRDRIGSGRCRTCPALLYLDSASASDRFVMRFDKAVSTRDFLEIPFDEFKSLTDVSGSAGNRHHDAAERLLFVGLAMLVGADYSRFVAIVRSAVSEHGPRRFLAGVIRLAVRAARVTATGSFPTWESDAWGRIHAFGAACACDETAVAVLSDLLARFARLDAARGPVSGTGCKGCA